MIEVHDKTKTTREGLDNLKDISNKLDAKKEQLAKLEAEITKDIDAKIAALKAAQTKLKA